MRTTAIHSVNDDQGDYMTEILKTEQQVEREIRDRIAAEIRAAHERATYDPHARDEGCEDCNIWYAAYDIAKGESE